MPRVGVNTAHATPRRAERSETRPSGTSPIQARSRQPIWIGLVLDRAGVATANISDGRALPPTPSQPGLRHAEHDGYRTPAAHQRRTTARRRTSTPGAIRRAWPHPGPCRPKDSSPHHCHNYNPIKIRLGTTSGTRRVQDKSTPSRRKHTDLITHIIHRNMDDEIEDDRHPLHLANPSC
jgi:hypothetical protein